MLVVVGPPRLDLDLRILQRREPALVQALLPEPTVETFYIRVLDRFSWPYEVEFHAVPVCLLVHGSRSELRPVVRRDDPGQPMRLCQPLQNRHHPLPRDRGAHLDGRANPAKVIH